DDRLLPDRALGAQALCVRADPAPHRLAPAVHPAVDRSGRERARRGAAAARGAPQADRGRARAGRGDPRRGAQDTGVDGAAEARFGAAKDAGRLAQVHEALSDFAAAAAELPELRAVLRNPQLEPSAKGTILADVSGDEEPLFAHFLQVVAEKGRAGELEEIA